VFPWIVAIYFRERAAEREANQGLPETIFRARGRFNPQRFSMSAGAPTQLSFSSAGAPTRAVFLRAGAAARANFSGAQASQAGRFRA
jgi:hypothetical protein